LFGLVICLDWGFGYLFRWLFGYLKPREGANIGIWHFTSEDSCENPAKGDKRLANK
jgi:hypothetical protein